MQALTWEQLYKRKPRASGCDVFLIPLRRATPWFYWTQKVLEMWRRSVNSRKSICPHLIRVLYYLGCNLEAFLHFSPCTEEALRPQMAAAFLFLWGRGWLKDILSPSHSTEHRYLWTGDRLLPAEYHNHSSFGFLGAALVEFYKAVVGIAQSGNLLMLQGDKKNDMWIFCLAVLLSSALVYNSKAVIDEDAIEKLQYP